MRLHRIATAAVLSLGLLGAIAGTTAASASTISPTAQVNTTLESYAHRDHGKMTEIQGYAFLESEADALSSTGGNTAVAHYASAARTLGNDFFYGTTVKKLKANYITWRADLLVVAYDYHTPAWVVTDLR